MGDFLVKILTLFGGWGWITIGIIIIAGGSIMLAVYLREPHDHQALIYSLRNYAYLLGVGILAIVLGLVEFSRDRPTPSNLPFKFDSTKHQGAGK